MYVTPNRASWMLRGKQLWIDSWIALKLVEDVKAFGLVKTNNKKTWHVSQYKERHDPSFKIISMQHYLFNSNVMNTNVKAIVNMIHSVGNSCSIQSVNCMCSIINPKYEPNITCRYLLNKILDVLYLQCWIYYDLQSVFHPIVNHQWQYSVT